MDLGFYAAYQHSGGDNWRATASYPPMMYPTHSVGGVLGALESAHAVSVSCLGVRDQRGDGVFDKKISQFANDLSNATALFELSDGGIIESTSCVASAIPRTFASHGSGGSARRAVSNNWPP